MQELNDAMTGAVTTLKALSDRNRLRILAALDAYGELCACQFSGMLGISAATVSRHMAILIAAGLVAGRKDGRWMHYRLDSSDESRVRALAWVREALSGDACVAKDFAYLETAPPAGEPAACAGDCAG
jgi:ArsR family transcriptional regulator, arsenate/arsenite/antimonite-responsive transcriptional repressor